MRLTDFHYVNYVPGDKYVLNKTQRGLVRQHIWRKRKSRSKHTSTGPLQWSYRDPNDGAARASEESKPSPPLASVKSLMTRDRFLHGLSSGDPFDSLPISTTQWPGLSRTFDLFFQGYNTPNDSCSSSSFVPHEIKYPILHAMLPVAVQNPDLFAALLADVQYWHDVTMSQRRDDGDQVQIAANLPPAVLFYRGQAIRHIRHKMIELTRRQAMGQSSPDDALIIAITYAMGTDTYAGDETSHAIHADALKLLVRMRGGIGSPDLSPLLRHSLLVHNFFLTDECDYPRLFPRDDYAATFPNLTYPAASTQATFSLQLLDLPPIFEVLLTNFPNLVSLQVSDLLSRLSSWTSLLQRVWLGPSHVTQADRAALLRDDIFRIVEDSLYCLKLMPSLPKSDEGDRHDRTTTELANFHPSASPGTASLSQQSLHPPHTNVLRDESRKGEAFETRDTRVPSPPRQRMWLADFERTLLLAFLLHGLTCFYPSGAKLFKMFNTAREELTALLLDASASWLGSSLEAQEVDRSHKQAKNGEQVLGDVVIWCICVAAEGWRLPDRNGHEHLDPRGMDLLTVSRDYLDHRLRMSQDQRTQMHASSSGEVYWEHLEAILRGGLYCGQRGAEWKLCWDEFMARSPREK